MSVERPRALERKSFDPMPDTAAYDQFFFESFPDPERHINRLFVMATLAGLSPKGIASARVLEIGCSTAAHLLPQAERYPRSFFVGIDLSAGQIEQGIQSQSVLGLKNIALHATDFRDYEDRRGSFDYVICHGMYSWIADDLRRPLLESISRLLSPTGVAYVSYNCSAAWRRRQSVQDIFRGADRPRDPSSQRIARARALHRELRDSLSKLVGQRESSFAEELHRLEHTSDQLLLHEYLAEGFRSYSVSEFAKAAQECGLVYLGDARPRRNYFRFADVLPAGALRSQFEKRSAIECDDLFDSIEAKSFRGAVLVKSGDSLPRCFSVDRLRTLHISSSLVPLGAADDSQEDEIFLLGNEEPVEIADRELRHAIRRLHALWPKAVPIETLFSQPMTDSLAALISELYWKQCVELSYDDLGCASELPQRPIAPAHARYRASAGGVITSLHHEQVILNDFARMIVSQLDGTRTIEDLVALTTDSLKSGEIEHAGSDTPDGETIREAIADLLDELLERGLILDAG